jgi:hypothetical protein
MWRCNLTATLAFVVVPEETEAKWRTQRATPLQLRYHTAWRSARLVAGIKNWRRAEWWKRETVQQRQQNEYGISER